MKIVVFKYMRGLLPPSPSGTMIAAAPDGAPRGGLVTEIQKNSLPGVPRKGPEAGVLRRENNFHDSGVSRIDSCLFLQSHFFVYFSMILILL
jgi:hypothetical protein